MRLVIWQDRHHFFKLFSFHDFVNVVNDPIANVFDLGTIDDTNITLEIFLSSVYNYIFNTSRTFNT